VPGTVWAELSLVCLTLAGLAAVARLFVSPWRLFVPVAAVAGAVHLIAAGCRRLGWGLRVAAPVSLVAGAAITMWVTFGAHTTYGLPSSVTWHALRHAMIQAADRFRTTSPPTAVVPGLVVVAAAAGAVAAFLSDWGAFRVRSTTEACLPSFTVFVFAAGLAHGHHALAAAGVFLSALLGFLLMKGAVIDTNEGAWFASAGGVGAGGVGGRGVGGRGAGAVIRAGALLGVAAVVPVLVVGPHLPGATTHALVDWRHGGIGGPGGRSTSSPLVDIRARLVDRSQVEVFKVASSRPAYWRLTSLDSFDGSGWSLNDTYGRAGRTLRPAGPTANGIGVSASFAIENLDSIWLPAPFRPLRYYGTKKASYSPDADSLISDSPTSDGDTYTVDAIEPVLDSAGLAQLGPALAAVAADPSMARYLRLPAGLPPAVVRLAHQVVGRTTSEYEMARRLQDWFRDDFTYSLDFPADDSQDALLRFLSVRRGFCQQFAGTYAVMARALGLPTRVAVGFTPGEPGTDGRYHVRDLHAHAWPEVWFARVGWVAFEPTPGRGAPGAQAYTGVPPEQASDTGGVVSVSPPAAANAPTGRPNGATPATTAPARPQSAPRPAAAATAHRGWLAGWAWLAALAGGLAAAVSGVVAAKALRRRRRRRAAAGAGVRAEVALAWDEAMASLATVGAGPRPTETPSEYATRSAWAAGLPTSVTSEMAELAELVGAVRYAPPEIRPLEPSAAAAAWRTVQSVSAVVRDRVPRWRRAMRAADPRPLIRG